MTIIIEGEKSFMISAQAHLLSDDRETASAWASKHITGNPAIKWVLGNYVEANRANHNKQYWSYADLRLGQPSVTHAPLNILHRPKHIVGAFTATEMIYPETDAAGEGDGHPYIEALAAFWKTYFPEELEIVEKAHNQGSLFFSMECVAHSMTCAGDAGCGKEFAYVGPKHETYCEHLNSHASIKQLNKPWFLGGALIFPPAAPGWGGANITEVSNLLAKYEEQIPGIYDSLKAEADHLTESELTEVIVEHLEVVDANVAEKKDPKKMGKKWGKEFFSKK